METDMTATAWAHLPNATVIDAVIADAKARPDVWTAAWVAAWGAAWDAAWDAVPVAAWAVAWDIALEAAWGAAESAARTAAWHAARDSARTAARDSARAAAGGAVLALVAWDDCAHLLGLPSTTLRTMIDLCDAPACHQAVLLLPYVLVKEAGQ